MVGLFRSKLTRVMVLLLVLAGLACLVPMLRHPPEVFYEPVRIDPDQEVDSRSLKQTAVLATLDCPLPEHKNAIWCSTFQMAWDKLKTDVIGEAMQLQGAEELANRLNRTAFPTQSIEPQSYYANAGLVRDGILERIKEDMANRFPSNMPSLGDENGPPSPEAAVAYAYLSVDIAFEHAYYMNKDPFAFTGSDGRKSNVTSFCSYAPGLTHSGVRQQVDIVYYRGGKTPEFAVDLCTKTKPYQVILARIPRCGSLGEAARLLEERIAGFKTDPDYWTLHELHADDTLVAPDVLYKLTHQFDELLGKYLGNQQWQNDFIFEAMQRIDFTLSRSGVVLKSEAATATRASRDDPTKPRHLRFDKPFLICVKKRETNTTPFFLMWVDNAELMQPASREP